MSSKRFQRSALRLQSRVTCPHCWHHFAPHDTLWVSQDTELLGDPRLGKEQQLRFLPTRFTPEGDAIDSRGFACQMLACPNCHLVVPRALLEMDPLFFSILGAPASGKSYFLASMTWQLRKVLPKYFNLSLGDADPSINETLNSYEELLFLNSDPETPTTLPKTDTEGAHLYDSVLFGDQTIMFPRPYVFGLRPLEGHPYFEQRDRLSRALCLYDNAGEHFIPGSDKLGTPVTRHLALSRVLFFLFDPSQDPDFRRACAAQTADPQMRDRVRTYRQELVLLEAAARVRRHAGLGQTSQHSAPLVVVVTKFDAWQSLLGDVPKRLDLSQIIRAGKGDLSAVDLSAVEEMSRRVRKVMLEHRSEFVAAAEGFCKEVIYVPVSALGRPPESQAGTGALLVRPQDIQPMWAEVPMLYALARWVEGLIPYTGGAAANGRTGGSHGGQPPSRKEATP